MKTYRLPIIIEKEEDKSYIKDLCRQQSIIVRSGYNDLCKGLQVKDLEKKYKSLKNIPNMDSWFIRCGILRGKTLIKNKNLTFGGKHNFTKLLKGKLSKEEWKVKRTYSLELQGEVHQGGNRKFKLDLKNNCLYFKPNKNHRIEIKIPKIRSKWKFELQHIQELKACFTVRLSTSHIEIMVDESHFTCLNYEPKVGRVLGIDLNPDYIGYSISDYPSEKVILKKCYDTSALNVKSGFASSHPKSQYLKNKRKHEYIQIVKNIIKTAEQNHVEKIVIEDLNIKSKDFGNKSVNRKNNLWMRKLISTKLKMDCKVHGITVVEVNPAYSSVIGNLVHNDFDPVSSSLEIGRRGAFQFVKGKFYPSINSVKHQWKEMVTDDVKTWKDLYSKIKTLNLKYRVPLDKHQVGCRIPHKKSYTKIYDLKKG